MSLLLLVKARGVAISLPACVRWVEKASRCHLVVSLVHRLLWAPHCICSIGLQLRGERDWFAFRGLRRGFRSSMRNALGSPSSVAGGLRTSSAQPKGAGSSGIRKCGVLPQYSDSCAIEAVRRLGWREIKHRRNKVALVSLSLKSVRRYEVLSHHLQRDGKEAGGFEVVEGRC